MAFIAEIPHVMKNADPNIARITIPAIPSRAGIIAFSCIFQVDQLVAVPNNYHLFFSKSNVHWSFKIFSIYFY